jgi:galactose mutarotase-like enzyme
MTAPPDAASNTEVLDEDAAGVPAAEVFLVGNTLVLRNGESFAVLVPERGGMVVGLKIDGRELLYLDRRTLDDPAANVRGGIPVLFPSPGKLAGDAWSRDGRHGAMKQHGFARNLPWEVTATGDEGGPFATLRLRSSEATRAQYPWDFVATYTYRLRGRSLAIEMRIENTGASPMPFGAGFHPYFAVSQADKARTRIPTKATRAFDNKEKREIAFTGLDLTLPEVDMHLHDHGGSEASLLAPDLAVTLRGSPDFAHWVAWTLAGKDFVCLEPWTCPGNALNTGDRLIVLAPGQARDLSFEIALA